MKKNPNPVISLALVLFFLFQIPSLLSHPARDLSTKVGGRHVSPRNRNDPEIVNLAKFAVSQHNSKQNAMLQLTRVLKVEEQVVAGMLYYITLEANDGKVYEAKVWVKPWMNFKQLQEFKRVDDVTSCTSADRGMDQGWTAVSPNDSGVQHAAEHAIKIIQQRSNSLSPYELLGVTSAKYKVFGKNSGYDLLLKVRRGVKEEKFRVEVNKSADGKFILCSMEEVPSKI